MKTNRRTFLLTATTAAALRPSLFTLAQEPVTSGGIGLTLADVQSMYEELPVGQSFRNFAEPETGATLYISFGETDFAQDIWVSGEMTDIQAEELVHWLCPDDIEISHRFEMLTGAGSISIRSTTVFASAFLEEIEPGRQSILATYAVEGGPDPMVREIHMTVEQA